MIPMLILLLTLTTLATPVAAANYYQYGQQVLISPPLTITAPGSVTWSVTMPAFGLLGIPYAKQCRIHGAAWDGSEPPEDQDVTLYAVRTNFRTGTYRLVYGDRSPSGRTYQVCLRLPFMTLPGLYKALEPYEDHGDHEDED